MSICGGKTRAGRLCRYPAGFGTVHPGEGRCYLHGGTAQAGQAKVLQAICANPEMAHRALELLEDEDLLSARRELAVLKARFELLEPKDDDADVPNLMKLADTISRMAARIQDMEQGKHHYIHISVAASLVAAFTQIGQTFIPDPAQRERFLEAVEGQIRKDMRRTSARAVAAHALVPDSALTLGVKSLDTETSGIETQKVEVPGVEVPGAKVPGAKVG